MNIVNKSVFDIQMLKLVVHNVPYKSANIDDVGSWQRSLDSHTTQSSKNFQIQISLELALHNKLYQTNH